ncbi:MULTISPECIES: stage III sporulation protein AF [unclassified Paenibacillus]|uniref:stage III sporulation protein AF n=1 Tax=unclassified Paenibacillus TaxID=185978 RepID=UPI002F423EF7
MTSWLVEWLRNIIAVILLAVIVDMLLPNKTMQRYARLAIGLIILLTILSPILNLLKQDVGKKLEESVKIWDQRSIEKGIKMPTLEDIQKKGEALQKKYQSDALSLTEQTIEQAMLEQLEQQIDQEILSVSVQLELHDSSDAHAKIEQVVVTVRQPQQGAENAIEGNGGSKASGETDITAIAPIAPIKPVEIAIKELSSSIDVTDANQGMENAEAAEKNEHFPDAELEKQIKRMISTRWEVNERLVIIKALA